MWRLERANGIMSRPLPSSAAPRSRNDGIVDEQAEAEYVHKREKAEWEAEKKAKADEIECLARGKRKLESEHMELIKELNQLKAEKEEQQKDLGKERVLSGPRKGRVAG